MLTDNDIMKALRCCADRYCRGCSEQGKANCRESIAALAWDLICRQKAEIERLHNEVKEKTETITLLKDQATGWSIYFCNLKSKLKTAKSEAIKEFTEKLKEAPIKMGIPLLELQTKSEIEEYFNGILLQFRDAIDDLVKEMTGEKT